MNLKVMSDPPARKPSIAATLALNTTQNAINSAQRASAFSEISQVEGRRTPLSANGEGAYRKKRVCKAFFVEPLRWLDSETSPTLSRLIVENRRYALRTPVNE